MPSAEEIILAEKEAFDELKASLLEEHRDEYVLFKDGEVHSFHADHGAAYDDGIKTFGVDAVFLVERISEEPEPSVSVTWELGVLHVNPQ